MSLRIRLALILAMALSCLGAPFATSAITVLNPVHPDYVIPPGGSRQDTVTLINDTAERQTFALTVENFIAKGENGDQEYLKEDQPTGLASWIHVSQPSVTLDPGESRAFPFLITVPENAEPGGHYATIFFGRASGSVQGSGIGIAEQVGVLLLVTVPGNIRESLEIDSFRVRGATVVNHLPLDFELRVRNTGSVHERVNGSIDIRNMFGGVVRRIPVNPKNAAVLPSSVRRIETSWEPAEPVRSGGFFAAVSNEWNSFGFGKYTATLSATYGSTNASLPNASVSFWIVPWRLIGLAIGSLVLLILIVAVYNRLLIRAVLKRNVRVKP